MNLEKMLETSDSEDTKIIEKFQDLNSKTDYFRIDSELLEWSGNLATINKKTFNLLCS